MADLNRLSRKLHSTTSRKLAERWPPASAATRTIKRQTRIRSAEYPHCFLPILSPANRWPARSFLSEDGATLEELGDAFGMSKERVRQIETRALENLKMALELNEPRLVPGASQLFSSIAVDFPSRQKMPHSGLFDCRQAMSAVPLKTTVMLKAAIGPKPAKCKRSTPTSQNCRARQAE